MIGNMDPNSGEGTADPLNTVRIGYFDMFGITGALPPQQSPTQTGGPPAPTGSPSAASWLQANSTVVFLGAAAVFVMALISRRR